MTDQTTDNASSSQDGAVDKPAVSRGPFLIEWEEWHHKCADGCCDRYGIEVWVDGRSIGSREFGDAGGAMEMLLEYLGHSAEVRQRFSDHG